MAKKKPAKTTNYKKWIGYGVLGLGAYLLLFSGSNSYQETRMLGGGAIGGGSPQETGYLITPSPNVTYNLAGSEPSAFTYVSASDSPSPTSPTSTSSGTKKSTSSPKIATSPFTKNVYNPNTGVYTDRSGLGYSMASAPSGSAVVPVSNIFTQAVANNPNNLGVSSAYGSTVGEVSSNTKKETVSSPFTSAISNPFTNAWGGK